LPKQAIYILGTYLQAGHNFIKSTLRALPITFPFITAITFAFFAASVVLSTAAIKCCPYTRYAIALEVINLSIKSSLMKST
jgi:hypothetical protein